MEFCSQARCIFRDSMATKLSVFLTFFAKQWTFLDFFKCSTKSTNLCISFSVRTNFACKQYIFDYNTLWFSISSIPQPFFCSSISGQQPQIYYLPKTTLLHAATARTCSWFGRRSWSPEEVQESCSFLHSGDR